MGLAPKLLSMNNSLSFVFLAIDFYPAHEIVMAGILWNVSHVGRSAAYGRV
jgi:hypothetical protein